MRASLLCLSLLLAAPAGRAQALDTSFGDDGFVITRVDGQRLLAQEVFVLPDGGAIVAAAGRASPSAPDYPFLARHLPDGGLDPSFGSGGLATADQTVSLTEAIRLPDGKVVFAGTDFESPNSPWVLGRFNADGSLDASFGTGGVVSTTMGDGYNYTRSLTRQPDGKLLVGGSVDAAPSGFGLARFNADGSPDASFGTEGRVLGDVGLSSDFVSLACVVLIQPDGMIVAVVQGDDALGDDHAAVWFQPDGTFDLTFGEGGIARVPGDMYRPEDAVLQPDGKIVVYGHRISPAVAFIPTLTRLLPDGALDTGFGTDGVATLDDADLATSRVVLQPDGKLLGSGSAGRAAGLVRVNADGTPDATFGTDGALLIPMSGYVSFGRLALQGDGKLLYSGTNYDTNEVVTMRIEALGLVVSAEGRAPGRAAALALAGPNPFAGRTALRLTLDAPAHAALRVYDVLGREVAALHEGPLGAGQHVVPFEAGGLPAGVYVARLRTPRGAQTLALTLVR